MSRMADQFDERAGWFGMMAKGLAEADPWRNVCEMGDYWLRRAAQEIRDRDAARAEADRLRAACSAMVESVESLKEELESREGQMKQRRDERKRSMDPDEAESADMYNAGIRYAVEELQPAVEEYLGRKDG